MAQSSGERWTGRRVFLIVYLIAIFVAGGFGLMVGTRQPAHPMSILGIVMFQDTPLGIALFGMVTVALILGSVFILVEVVSRRIDSEGID
jgi:polyferredoxin